MENNTINNLQNEEGYSEDTLSLCDLSIDKDEETELYVSPENPIQDQDFFEFLVNPEDQETNPSNETVLFCGKTMSPRTAQEFQRHPNNGLYIRRESFKRCHSFKSESSSIKQPLVITTTDHSNSFRLCGPVPSPATGKGKYKSSGSQKHKVLIGLSKVQSKMELSDIKKRQSRRTPSPMFLVSDGAEQAIAGDDKVVAERSHWGLLGTFRCRSHFVSALSKASFSCMHHHV